MSILSLAGSRPVGILGGLAASFFENRRLEEHQKEQLRQAEEARGRLVPALERGVADVERIAEENLLRSREFFGDAVGRFRGVADPLLEDVGERTRLGIRGAQDIARGVGALETEGRGQGERLFGLQQEREARLLGEFGDLGRVEREELNRRFGALGRTEQARLTGAGLGGTTLATGVASGVERARSRDLASLNERLRRERLGFSERLSGETLSTRDLINQRALELGRGTLEARGGALEFATDLRGQGIQARGELGFEGLATEQAAFEGGIRAETEFGTAGSQAALAAAERLNRFELEEVVEEPPPSGLGSQLAFRGTQSAEG